MRYFLAIYAALIAIALSSAVGHSDSLRGTPAQIQEFEQFLQEHPDQIFSGNSPDRVRQSVADYHEHKLLPNRLHYGDSVRNYDIRGKAVSEVRRHLTEANCALKIDVIREPVKNQPSLFQGSTVPLWIFLCPDGGVVRVKPKGDPTSPFRTWVHGNKSLRFPYDSKFDNFSDEVVKIDFAGHAVPKSRGELGPQKLLMGWVESSHADLRGE